MPIPADTLAERIERRARLASFEAELIAISRDLLARSEALLQETIPTTFMGGARSVPWPKREG